MNHCLVFGARGHLARTRIIPALTNRSVPYTGISRSSVSDVKHLEHVPDIVAYMAIPTHNFCENVQPYMDQVNALYVLEKPHGHSIEDFDRIRTFVSENNLNVLYNDHYLGKKALEIVKIPETINNIKIVLHEDDDMNERVNYFDTVGIVGDMYQSHCVIIIACILSKYTGKSRKEILKEIQHIKPDIRSVSKSCLYTGYAPTECKVFMKYDGIEIEADIAKMVSKKKGFYVNDTFYDLNEGPCPYEHVFEQIENRQFDFFLDEEEVKCLWNHTSIKEC